ncbi:MAG TPA: hypothetical protein VH592_17800 [Gemmataceae bacterium]
MQKALPHGHIGAGRIYMAKSRGFSRPINIPNPESVEPDTPLRLSVAAALAFPDGSMSASGLRREAARGRLIIERIAGKDYTTLANIERMRNLCRVEAKAPASTFAVGELTGRGVMNRSGSSGTATIRQARAALHATLLEQNEPSPLSSPTNTQKPRARASASRTKSLSPTS